MDGTRCPACDSTSLETLESVDVAKQHKFYAPDNVTIQKELTEAASATCLIYERLRCKQCALEFASPLKAPTSEWYAIAYRAMNLYPMDRWEFGEVIRHIRPGERIFEIGCGSGMFLEKCREAGIAAEGIDFNDASVAACKAKGLNATRMHAGEQDASKTFDHIAAFQVIEHLDNPREVLFRASRMATKETHLWVSVPSDRYIVRLRGETEFLDLPPHHMSRWSPKALAAIGSATGWELSELAYEPVSLRKALWHITRESKLFKRYSKNWQFEPRRLEYPFHIAALPYSLVKRMTSDRDFSGVTMLAHYTTS